MALAASSSRPTDPSESGCPQSALTLRVLALDLATHTGWAVVSTGLVLHGHGTVDGSSELRAPYPFDILDRATHAVELVLQLVREVAPDEVVIEDTNPGGRASRHSQKWLEQAHCLLLQGLDSMSTDRSSRDHVHYIDSRAWRKAAGVKMSADDRDNNRRLAKVRRELRRDLGRKPTPKELSTAKQAVGIGGKRNIKHAAIEWANRQYGLALTATQSDTADAIGIGTAFLILNP